MKLGAFSALATFFLFRLGTTLCTVQGSTLYVWNREPICSGDQSTLCDESSVMNS